NAQDAAIAELRQSDPQLALLQSVARGGNLTTPPPSQQGSLSLPPPAQTPPEQPTAQKRKQRQPVEATAATDRPKRQRKAVRYKF
ncbi:hypothetical protein KXV52_001858, partial [Aspergillus fumigatus]